MTGDVKMCDSPIEEAFLRALSALLQKESHPIIVRQQVYVTDDLKQEFRRTDFVLNYFGQVCDTELHIPSDSWEWHAATRDRFSGTCKRNRFYTEHGKLLVAFSGQEINEAASKCAKEAVRILITINQREEARTQEAEARLKEAVRESEERLLNLSDKVFNQIADAAIAAIAYLRDRASGNAVGSFDSCWESLSPVGRGILDLWIRESETFPGDWTEAVKQRTRNSAGYGEMLDEMARGKSEPIN